MQIKINFVSNPLNPQSLVQIEMSSQSISTNNKCLKTGFFITLNLCQGLLLLLENTYIKTFDESQWRAVESHTASLEGCVISAYLFIHCTNE